MFAAWSRRIDSSDTSPKAPLHLRLLNPLSKRVMQKESSPEIRYEIHQKFHFACITSGVTEWNQSIGLDNSPSEDKKPVSAFLRSFRSDIALLCNTGLANLGGSACPEFPGLSCG